MSTTKHICELCNKIFTQKGDLTKHKNKKTPCISMDKIQELTLIKASNKENKSNIATIFKYCLDILRDNEHITGDKALRNLAFLLDLRLLEKQFNDKIIDIDNYNYDFSSYESSNEEFNEEHKKKLLGFTRFSNLVKANESNLYTIMKYLWDDILSEHPITKNIFFKDKCFEIQNQSTYKKLIDKLYNFKFEDIEADILGEAYEHVISDVMTGKVLGQFFTPPKIKQMMVNLLNPQLNNDGTIETIFDPAMGTGGFLITSIRHIIKQSKFKKIDIDWNFISQHGLGGREAEPDTYQLAISNMLISTGHMFNVLEKGDSIRNPITKKYDIVLANPPFGIDGLNYLEIKHELRDKYLPIKSNSAVPLFLQAIIYMLKINGRCAIVLPDGKELFSKNNELVTIREYLMKTCELKEIIYLPSGVFTHTSIKTCVFYFIKKKEGTEILETTVKYSKIDNKEIERKNIFSKMHQTTKVKFYDYNPYEDIKNLLVEVNIDKLIENNYSLNYQEYLDEKEENYNDEIVIKKLCDVCDINQGESLTKDKMIVGDFNVIGGGKVIGKHNNKNRNENEITLTRVGDININFMYQPYFLTDNGFSIKSNNNILLTKYLYYLLFNNNKILDNLYKGTAQKVISKTNLKLVKIPIPSIEQQEEIVKYLDFIYEECIKTSNEKIIQLKKLNEYCLNNQKNYGENIIKKFKEVCKVNQGTYIKSDMKIKGEYPVYGGGNVSYYINQYNREDEIIVAKDGVSIDCVRYEKNKFFLNHHGWTLTCNDIITKKYMFYYLQLIQTELLSIAKGTAQLGINQENFYKLKIPIPSIEKQKEIIDYCENNDNLIKQLENENEQNKKLAKEFITNIMNNFKQNDNIDL